MSTLPGVFTAQKKNGSTYYRSSITHSGKHISLGSYTTPSAAHEAYLEAGKLLDSAVSLSSYKKESHLSFEKWVCLINFRDNLVYFKNPIYLKKNFFYYYLTYEDVLIFDVEDLFYYARHKIMRRGGHLFVADFGMQVTIASRYGIKNYAVIGKDYRFINENTNDFRYENIEILNTYHGVHLIHKDGRVSFTSHIHIRGNYLLGTYATAQEAAIAYNKAIDLLKKAGSHKNYTPNYIENMSGSVYASIYSGLTLSGTFLDYCNTCYL